ncbi:Trypsin [Oryctes borbonicus]|uniref:Trypsin n=1 Tax=Oryctes borbonicus TaxID=1629725 RepID=A0A0T6B821_9SCAR|nr:Trypsin [Oryctes borbonicus]
MNAILVELSFVLLSLVVRDSFSADFVSRCPKILRYEEQIEEDRYQAVLELKSRQGSEGVWLNIALDSKADALINTFGPSTTLNNQNFQINNPEYILLPGAPLRVKFTIKYDKNNATPVVESIKLNGVEICDGSSSTIAITEATNEVVTSRRDAPTQRPFVPSTGKTLLGVTKLTECGLKAQASPLVYNGRKAEGHWPWHIAIMKLNNIQYDYHCGGTLISAKSVLTAAHCVTILTTTKLADKDMYILYLGITNLSDQGPYFKVRLVQNIIVHNEYNPARYHNDLAIIDVDPVEFNDYLRPICLWEGDLEITGLVGKYGTIVGWGIDNSNHTTADLMEGKMPVVSLDTCLYHDPTFFALYTSPTTFCAGGPNGTAVCSGDSGGGMVFPRRASIGNAQVWYIRGIVSVSPRDSETVCNTKSYFIFVDVARHLAWIKKTAGI